MKRFRIPLFLFVAGIAGLILQIRRPKPAEALPVVVAKVESKATDVAEKEAGTESSPVSLASLTQGLEDTADVSEGGSALSAKFAQQLESLTPAQRRAVFADVTRQLNQLTEAELKARTTDDPERRRAMLLIPALVGLLQRSDPATVLAWSLHPDLSKFWKLKVGRLAAETLGIYAKTEPAAALAWTRQNAADLPEPERAWNATLAGIAGSNLSLALQEARERGVLAGALEAMVPVLTTSDAKQKWIGAVSELDDSTIRARNWAGLIRDQVQIQGWERASSMLQTDLPAEAMTPENLQAIAKEALTRDPMKFANTLAGLPESMASQAIPDFIGTWTERDFNAAASWLRTAPDDAPWRDATIAAFVEKIAPLDPAAAQVWSATINDPATRERLTRK